MSEPTAKTYNLSKRYSYTTDNNGSTSTANFGPYLYVDGTNGVTNPGWRQQIRAHINAGTDFVGNRHKIEENIGLMTLTTRDRSTSTGAIVSGSEKTFRVIGSPLVKPLPLGLSAASVSQADAMASGKFYGTARKLVSPNNIAEGLGEYHQLLSLLRVRGTQLFHSFPKYVDRVLGNGKGLNLAKLKKLPVSSRAKQLLGIVSDSYLEFNFGIRPTIKDIASAIEEISRMPRVLDYTVTSADGESQSNASVDQFSLNVGNLLGTWTESKVETAQVRYRGAVVIEKADTSQVVLDDLGLSLDNFIPTLYQLFPYSFVVDYFLNLGSIVNAGCFASSRLAWCIRSERRITSFKANTNAVFMLNSIGPGYRTEIVSISHSPSSLSIERHRVQRTVITQPPVPSLVLTIPSDPTQWVNLGALIAQRVSKWSSFISPLLRK